jgi:hypothetical protein
LALSMSSLTHSPTPLLFHPQRQRFPTDNQTREIKTDASSNISSTLAIC